jgi:LysR family transcriptional regulator, regulator for bpeEF and oprC
MERKIDLNALRTFVTTVELGSLSKAGRYLEMPESTVSRHVAKLEEQLGLKLVVRDQSGIELTSAGRSLYDSSRAGLDSFRSVRKLVAQTDPIARGLIRIRAPTVFGRAFLVDIISDFCAAFADVSVKSILSDRIFDPEDDDVDVAFCVGIAIPNRLEFWNLGTLEAKLYAAPAFLQPLQIGSPADLQGQPILSGPFTSAQRDSWTLRTLQGREHRLTVFPRLEVNETDFLTKAAIKGLGIVRLPSFIGAPLCTQGDLVPVLPDWFVDSFSVSLTAKKKLRTQAVDAFIEFSRERVRQRMRATDHN